ncbi:hypothetical protein [Rubrivirga sp. IMCC43871]|uniref:hypothetical protein n=1 Tax=Rubrivirga sp. IMCC43871 TaxID=3391575 RepID=UPI00398FC4A8
MPLSRSQSRLFAAVFVAAILILSVVATLMITRGWGNDAVQGQVEQQETERREAMPKLSQD